MKYLIAILSFICLGGCMGYYHHKVVNVGTSMLSDVTVQCGEHSFDHGYLPPNAHKSYSGSFELDKKSKIIVKWSVDGKSYSKEIVLTENPGSKEVVFNLDGKNVTVAFGKESGSHLKYGTDRGRP